MNFADKYLILFNVNVQYSLYIEQKVLMEYYPHSF